MIALSEVSVVSTNSAKGININDTKKVQELSIYSSQPNNAPIQIAITPTARSIDVVGTQPQQIEIGIPRIGDIAKQVDVLAIEIGNKVPKQLSILPQITSDELATDILRALNKMYVDAGGNSRYITLEQIKQLNTKVLCVDALGDNKINTLSREDIVLLKEG